MRYFRLFIIIPLLILVGCESSNRDAVDALDEIGDRIFASSRNRNESVVYNARYFSDTESQIVIFEVGLPNIIGVLELRNVDCWKDRGDTIFDCQTSSSTDNSELGRLYRLRHSLAAIKYATADENDVTYEYSENDLTNAYGNRYRP